MEFTCDTWMEIPRTGNSCHWICSLDFWSEEQKSDSAIILLLEIRVEAACRSKQEPIMKTSVNKEWMSHEGCIWRELCWNSRGFLKGVRVKGREEQKDDFSPLIQRMISWNTAWISEQRLLHNSCFKLQHISHWCASVFANSQVLGIIARPKRTWAVNALHRLKILAMRSMASQLLTTPPPSTNAYPLGFGWFLWGIDSPSQCVFHVM